MTSRRTLTRHHPHNGGPPLPCAWMRTTVVLCLTMARMNFPVRGQEFDPYDMNGGLVSGIAGRNFVIMASDTRLGSYGSYQILSRSHLASRLWATASPKSQTTTMLTATSTDGSIVLPADYEEKPNEVAISLPFALVGSVGCVADCEALKRTMQADVLAHEQWSRPQRSALGVRVGVQVSSSTAFPKKIDAVAQVGRPARLDVNQVANLLGQVLYSRRSFPFYSFCVLGGLNAQGHGKIYIFDAIGSYEEVAVACAGVPGREMMQPILDRIFTPAKGAKKGSSAATTSTSPPSHVDCTVEEAITLLLKAYRSVAEREINVGDDVVLCVVQCTNESDGVENAGKSREARKKTSRAKRATMSVYKFPLKKH